VVKGPRRANSRRLVRSMYSRTAVPSDVPASSGPSRCARARSASVSSSVSLKRHPPSPLMVSRVIPEVDKPCLRPRLPCLGHELRFRDGSVDPAVLLRGVPRPKSSPPSHYLDRPRTARPAAEGARSRPRRPEIRPNPTSGWPKDGPFPGSRTETSQPSCELAAASAAPYHGSPAILRTLL